MTSYREIFFAHNGPGPWPCYGCDESVYLAETHVHHLDEDHTNDKVSNLTAMHSLCHMQLHKSGKSHSVETRQKMSEVRRGRQLSAEARRKLSDALRGKPKTEEHKANLSKALRGRPHSDAARAASFGKVLGPMSEEHKRKIGDANRGRTRRAS